MSVIRRMVKPRISTMVNRATGLSEAEALARAAAGIEALRDESLTALDAAIASADAAARTAPPAADAVYKAAGEILELSGTYGLEALEKAAYSLCELVDDLRSNARWNGPAVAVHLEAMRLLRAPGQAGSEAILEGLHAVLGRVRSPAA
jgi:hypothetical protein